MTTERDVASLAEDIQTMVGSYTSFMEGIALQDSELAWELAEKYADRLRDMTREAFADLAAEASEGLRKPAKKKRKKRASRVSEVASSDTSNIMPMGAEELPENPGSLLSQIQDPDQVDLALDRSMREQTLTERSEGREPPSNFNRNNPTMKRIPNSER